MLPKAKKVNKEAKWIISQNKTKQIQTQTKTHLRHTIPHRSTYRPIRKSVDRYWAAPMSTKRKFQAWMLIQLRKLALVSLNIRKVWWLLRQIRNQWPSLHEVSWLNRPTTTVNLNLQLSNHRHLRQLQQRRQELRLASKSCRISFLKTSKLDNLMSRQCSIHHTTAKDQSTYKVQV